MNYRDQSGGFTYWGRGEPDLALTAYALRFLSEASELIEVDDGVIRDARAWLIRQQRPDGSWAAYAYGDKSEDQRRTAMLTAFVARVVADGGNRNLTAPRQDVVPSLTESDSTLQRALDYLDVRIEGSAEPYVLAAYALAALEVGRSSAPTKASREAAGVGA